MEILEKVLFPFIIHIQLSNLKKLSSNCGLNCTNKSWLNLTWNFSLFSAMEVLSEGYDEDR
jgi:hypothetical protein